MHGENWFDKEFELGLSLEELPSLIRQLRSVPDGIERVVAGLSPEVLTRQIEGTWSVQQHVGHLADLEELHDGRLNDFETGVTALRPADLSNRKTEEGNHNEAAIEDLLQSFRNVRENFVRRLEALPPDVQAHSAIHPRLQKPMRVVDLAYFVAEHDAHHVEAIKWLCTHSS